MQGKPFHYFANGVAISEVEVDGFTGQYPLRRVDILHDVGDSLSPLVGLSQVEGGLFRAWAGSPWKTFVGMLRAAWRPVRPAPTNCPAFPSCLPCSTCSPLPKATEAEVVYGSKAVGELPLMLTISVGPA